MKKYQELLNELILVANSFCQESESAREFYLLQDKNNHKAYREWELAYAKWEGIREAIRSSCENIAITYPYWDLYSPSEPDNNEKA